MGIRQGCKFIPSFIPILLVFLAQPCHALRGINPGGGLDKIFISKSYFEGEFWTVINALEEFRKGGLKTASRDDSIYTFKYLSVVYAAEPATRVKAESYMYMLLKMMPTIDLLDLYISDNIEMVFQKVRKDYDRMQKLGMGNNSGNTNEKSDTTAIVTSSPTTKNRSSDSNTSVEVMTTPPIRTAVQSDPSTKVSIDKGRSTPVEKSYQANAQPKKIKPWVWIAIGGSTAVASATYFIVSDASSKKAAGPDPTWDIQFDPSH